jgi:hypothetical protein
MDANHPDDLNNLEQRLASCTPAADGLDADAMLFAAGRAAAGLATPGRFVWPALACFMTLLVAVLGVWLQRERAEKQILAQRLSEQRSMQHPEPETDTPSSVSPAKSPTTERPSPDSLMAAHRALDYGLDAWPPRAIPRTDPTDPPATDLRVLRVGQRDGIFDQ